MGKDRSRGIDRREFVKAAVAIGGVSALSACQETEGSATEGGTERTETPMFPAGTSDPASLPSRQHAWNDYLVNTTGGRFSIPQHQLILGLSYGGTYPPTEAEREQVSTALETVESAYQWGTGGNESAGLNNGALFMLGYAPSYFDGLGASVDSLWQPETVLEEAGEDPAAAADFDAALVVNADFGSILLSIEEALFGGRETINGQPVEADFEGVFELVDRRTGVVGKGEPASKLDNDDVPEEAPLSMGFRSAFADALPPEETVTIEDGPFAGGTTLMVSRLDTHLEEWYDQDHETRVKEMFTPEHTGEQVGETGQRLGRSSQVTKEHTERIEEHAEEYDVVGHTAKTAAARDENFQPVILRRSEGVATDEAGGSAFNFTSVQRHVEDFVRTRRAMNPEEYDDDVPAERHGIVDYLETVSRGVFVVPPRETRALPDPT